MGKNHYPGSGIRDKHPGFATLLSEIFSTHQLVKDNIGEQRGTGAGTRTARMKRHNRRNSILSEIFEYIVAEA